MKLILVILTLTKELKFYCYDGSVAFSIFDDSATYWYASDGALIKTIGTMLNPIYVTNNLLIAEGGGEQSSLYIETPTTTLVENNIFGIEEEVKMEYFLILIVLEN